MDGEIITNLQPKDTLDMMRHLARAKTEPDKRLCDRFNKKANNGKNMGKVSILIGKIDYVNYECKRKATLTVFF